jgi:hypothetical protein
MNMQKIAVTCLGALAALFSGVADDGQNAEMVLAERGKAPVSRIVLPENPTAVERYAADELERYARKMTGTGFAANAARAVFFEREDIDGCEDAFRLVVRGGDLYVSGGRMGILYAVYELLETYGGVGWFSPERTVVPKLEKFSVPADLNRTEKPAFAGRIPYWSMAFDPVFASRLRSNCDRVAFSEGQGGRSRFRFGKKLWICHTLGSLLPVEQYGKTHPEYFAERGGTRVVPGKSGYTQLCLTNPDVLAIVTSNVLARIRLDPAARYYGVSQNDNSRYCQCEKCSAVDAEEDSHSGTYVRFINKIAEAVEREFPGKMVETLAYQFTRKPPKKTKLRDNVIPCFCTIECDFAHPISTGKYIENVKLRNDIAGWAAISKQLCIWDYTTNFRYFPSPFPNFDVMQDNLRFFRSHGAEFVFEQGAYKGLGAEFEALKVWLLSKWLWNPDLEEGPLLERFFTGYYGSAAKEVRTYFDELRALPRPDGKVHVTCFDPPFSKEILPDEFLERSRRLWDKAVEKAKHDEPIVLTNVLMGAMSVDFTMFQRVKDFVADDIHLQSADPLGKAGRKKVRDMARRIKTLMETYPGIRFTESNEGDPVFKREIIAASRFDVAKEFVPTNAATLHLADFDLALKGYACEVVDDPTAAGGKALKFFNKGCDWCLQRRVREASFDPKCSYRMRVRVKIDAKPESVADFPAMACGVWNEVSRKGKISYSVKASKLKNGEWVWLDCGTWQPSGSELIWMSCGKYKGFKEHPSINALYFDQMEIIRCE